MTGFPYRSALTPKPYSINKEEKPAENTTRVRQISTMFPQVSTNKNVCQNHLKAAIIS